MNVAVLGASKKPDRYSYKAVMRLREKGHTVFPIHPGLDEVEGIKVYPSLKALPEAIDTITVYLSAANQRSIEDEILESPAGRVIFNPGAENPPFEERLQKAGKSVLQACTLVMLSTNQF